MKNPTHEIVRQSLLILTGVIWYVCLARISGITQMVWFISFPALCVIIHHRNISHPVTFYPIFFVLYAISYPILVWGGIFDADDAVIAHAFRLEGLAFLMYTFGFCVTACAYAAYRKIRPAESTWLNRAPVTVNIPLPLLLATFALTLIPLADALLHGYDKQSFRFSRFKDFLAFFYPLIAFIVIRYMALTQKGRIKERRQLFYLSLLYFIIAFGITGERDLLMVLVCHIVIYLTDVRRTMSPYLMYLYILIGIASTGIMQELKSFISTGIVDISLAYERGLMDIFYGEFMSASKNLYLVLERFEDLRMNGELLINDLMRVFNSNLLGIRTSQSAAEWYNRELLNHYGAGKGFSLVAECYLSYGAATVMQVFFLLGALISLLHSEKLRGPIMYFCYVNFMILSVYCIRADIAYLIGAFLKSSLLPAIMVIVFMKFFPERTQSTISRPVRSNAR